MATRRFLQRTRQILEEVYTEQIWFPIIDAMADTLRPEVAIRSRARVEDVDVASTGLDRNVASLKEHLVRRRQFLLDQE